MKLRALALLPVFATTALAQSLISLPSVTNGGNAGLVTSFAVSGTTLYIGGTFDTVGGQARSNVAAINLTNGTVSSFNPGASSSVTGIALSPDGSTLYAGGSFTTLGGSSRNYAGAVSTSTGSATAWNPDFNSSVNALTVNATTGTVFAVGDFTTASNGGTNANHVAAITSAGAVTGYAGGNGLSNGGEYRSIGTSTDGSTFYIAHIGNKTWDAAAGGTTTRAGFTALQTSDLTATAFNPSLQEGTFASPGQSLAVAGNSLYIGGQFDNVGGVPNDSAGTTRNRVAKYNMDGTGATGTLDTTFAPTSAANGANSSGIRGIIFVNGELYLLGGFTAYAGTNLNGLANVNATTGALDPSFAFTAAGSYFGGQPTFSFGDTTNTNLFISASAIAGGTILGAEISNSFVGISAIPEPSTYAALAGLGVLGLALWRRRTAGHAGPR